MKMAEHILVSPFNEKLISGLRQKALVVHTDDPGLVRYIYNEVKKENTLHAIRLHLEMPLADLKFEEDWRAIPLLIIANEFGEFRDFIQQVHLIRQMNLRIYLYPDHPFNMTGLQIMSSLQIPCGLIIPEDFSAWEEANDLMHYSVYGKTEHAPVEPFHHIASQYGPRNYVDYGSAYLDDPDRYLHLNETGQVALTRKDLEKKKFIPGDIDSLDNIEHTQGYQEHLTARYDLMRSMSTCAFCPSFRICLGKFSGQEEKDSGCKKFFGEMMEAADFYQLNLKHRQGSWQL